MWDDRALDDHLEMGQYEHNYRRSMLHPSASVCAENYPVVCHPAAGCRTAPTGCAAQVHAVPNAQHSRVPGGPASDGKFASEALSRYSERMNQLIAEAIIECIASGKSEPAKNRTL
jgi:hypothetical protein